MSTPESIDTGNRTSGLITIKAECTASSEMSVSYDLADILADDSLTAFRRFLSAALRFCDAGSAGLSLLRLTEAGQPVIRWQAVSGALAYHEGCESPRDFIPCGRCLDTATTTILPDPESAFPFLKDTAPWISEELMVPLCDDTGTPIGTLWLAHHDGTSHFDAADEEIAQQLAMLLERVLGWFEKEKCRQMPLALLESYELDRRIASRDLAVERNRREAAETAQAKLREALVCKEADLLDAHLRVKNSMQVAADYLQLQAGKSPFAHARAALHEAHCRLRLLAEVHGLLHQSSDAARRIPMSSLLPTLAQTLERLFSEKSARVTLHTTIAPIMLAADQAIPLALLVNEAITNAYKHAFPGRYGEIWISLQPAEEGALILQISDNGVGLPAGSDQSGLGLELIRSFAAQLGGTLLLSTPADSSGTMFTLTVRGQAGLGLVLQPTSLA